MNINHSKITREGFKFDDLNVGCVFGFSNNIYLKVSSKDPHGYNTVCLNEDRGCYFPPEDRIGLVSFYPKATIYLGG